MKKPTLAMLALIGAVAVTAWIQVPQTASANTQAGKASWYGSRYHGRKTASGERYNMNAFSGAHRSLAFGTRVCVHNLRNGRKVAVRINDRGPFVRGRVVDVSHRAAKTLGMVSAGTAPVKVTVLGKSKKSGSRC